MTIKQFEQLKWQDECSRTSMPSQYVPVTKYTDKTANGLTKLIIALITLQGGQAERINTTGRYLQGKSYVDVLGHNRTVKGKYIPGSGTKGSADISSTIKGKSVKWEVKMNDKQSEAQRKYQDDIERAGGLYFVVHNFEEFYTYYGSI